MANNFISLNTNFKPFTYQELLAPALRMTEAHNKLEDEYAALDIMNEDVGSKLNETLDPEEYRKYSDFQNKLSDAADKLATVGYTQGLRRDLAKLKAQYTKDINPINEAYKRLVADRDAQTKYAREHPELIVEGFGNRVHDYMNGNTPETYSANKNTIYTKSKEEAAATSSRFSFIDNPSSALGGQYWKYMTGQGINQDSVDALNAFVTGVEKMTDTQYNNLNNESKALYNIVKRQRAQSGYDRFSENGKSKIDASILNGIFAGATYRENAEYMADKSYLNALQQKQLDKLNEDPQQHPPVAHTNWARAVDRVVVNPDGTNTTQVQSDIDFLKQLQNNPQLLLKEETLPGYDLDGVRDPSKDKKIKVYENKLGALSHLDLRLLYQPL